jgi:putative flippase GtrA
VPSWHPPGGGAAALLAAVRSEVARFAVVGAVGFVVDAGLMHCLFSYVGWSPFVARSVSFPVALTTTFLLNRHWSFQGFRASASRAYATYAAIQIVGALLNLLIFSVCLLLAPPFYERPVIALAIGSAVAMLFNYHAGARLVFQARAVRHRT